MPAYVQYIRVAVSPPRWEFTPLDGLVMGTRCGSVDPSVLLYLMDHHHMDARALEHLLYHESGLLGVSGISNDMRTLLASDDPNAQSD